MVTGLLVIKFSCVVIFVVEKSDSCFAAIQFCNHSYNYRLNWTPPGLITTMKSLQCRSASVITGQILFYSVLLPWIRDYRLINPIFEGFHIYFFRQVKYVLWIKCWENKFSKLLKWIYHDFCCYCCCCFSLAGNFISRLKNHSRPVLCLSVDDKFIISGSEDKTLCVYDRRASQVYKTIKV